MIHYVSGKLVYKLDNAVVIDINGLGYKIFVPANSDIYLRKEGEQVFVFTYMVVKEDDISLYGFGTNEELEVFKKLITVNGVGSKAAIAIFSAMRVEDITKAIVYDDPQMLSRANGIGKKIAQRIILDLKDKIKTVVTDTNFVGTDIDMSRVDSKVEAINALMELGYTRIEATELVASVQGEELSTEDYIKLALKGM